MYNMDTRYYLYQQLDRLKCDGWSFEPHANCFKVSPPEKYVKMFNLAPTVAWWVGYTLEDVVAFVRGFELYESLTNWKVQDEE